MDLSTFKPDADEAVKRWEAFYQGELIDRPPVVVTAPRRDCVVPSPITYDEKAYSEFGLILEHAQAIVEATFWGGEAFPSFYPSFGPDELAVFCGAELHWNPDSKDTNWSVPSIEDWENSLPVQLQDSSPLYQRQLELYRQAAERFSGSILLVAPDLHSNMDLLAALRGPQRLCLDLVDHPELIDRAMLDSRNVFKQLWAAINHYGQMPQHGYCLESHGFFSKDGSATLQCDFSIMMNPRMFRRWVLPALEEEASLVRHAVYHWDGLGALVHKKDLLAIKGIHALSFVPGEGGPGVPASGSPVSYVGLLRELQDAGKAVHVWGTPEECQRMHRSLRPDRVFYCTQTSTQADAEALLDWFVLNT